MFKIHVFNVDLGDSLIIESSNEDKIYYSIVDCKKVGLTTPTVDFLSNNGIVNISTLIITHYHEDHTTGLPDLYEYLNDSKGTINYIISPYIEAEGSLKNEFFRIMYGDLDKKKRLKILYAIQNLQNLDTNLSHSSKPEVIRGTFRTPEWSSSLHPGVFIAFLHPNEQQAFSFLNGTLKTKTFKNDLNSISTVFILRTFNNDGQYFCTFFAGDLDNNFWSTIKNRYEAITKKNSQYEIKFLKLPHHGSKNAYMYEVLPNIIPKDNKFFTSISCPFNSAHHPHEQTLSFLINKFNNVCIACTNMSKHCVDQNLISGYENFFNHNEFEEQFEEFAEVEDIIPHQECAGWHTFISNDTFQLINSTGINCGLQSIE
ncbi:MAG: hypothetical protein ACOCP4_06105 [Candidatus Woesearchaeota archaeon]